MAFRFFARDGRRLASRASQPFDAYHRSSILQSKYTMSLETFTQTRTVLPEIAGRNAEASLGKQVFEGMSSAGSSNFHGTHLASRVVWHEAEPSFHGALSQLASSARNVESHRSLGLNNLVLTRYAVRESSQTKPFSFHGFSRSFSSFNIQSSSKRTVLPLNHITPKNALLKRISTDAITKRLKLSPPTSITQPMDGLKKTASKYKEVAGLQVEAFWKRNVMILVGAAGVLACFLLWQVMYGIANLFVSFSEGMAKFGFLAMAAATVAFAAMALRARYTINPDKVYRISMRMLNTSAAALEVLGAPLTGTDLRAYVMSSGGLKLKNLKPRFGNRRCFLIFPIQGSERKGLVSAEVKKKKGKYEFKMLAVDVAVPGADQRLFLAGDEAEYKVGGGLIGQLRDPILKAMAAQEEFDAQDEKEQEEEEKAEKAKRLLEEIEEEARRREEIERHERESSNK